MYIRNKKNTGSAGYEISIDNENRYTFFLPANKIYYCVNNTAYYNKKCYFLIGVREHGYICSIELYESCVKISIISSNKSYRSFDFGDEYHGRSIAVEGVDVPLGTSGSYYRESQKNADNYSGIFTVEVTSGNLYMVVRNACNVISTSKISKKGKKEIDAAIIQNPRVCETIFFVLNAFEKKFPGIIDFLKHSDIFKRLFELYNREVNETNRKNVEDTLNLYGIINPYLDLPKVPMRREKTPQ